MKIIHRNPPTLSYRESIINDSDIDSVDMLLKIYSFKDTKIRTKDTNILMRYYKPEDISLIGHTIWIPSLDFFDDKSFAIGMLLHELVHLYSRSILGFRYTLRWWLSKKYRTIYEFEAYTANLISLLYLNQEYPPGTLDQLTEAMMDLTKLDKSYILNKASKLMLNVHNSWNGLEELNNINYLNYIIQIIFDTFKDLK